MPSRLIRNSSVEVAVVTGVTLDISGGRIIV